MYPAGFLRRKDCFFTQKACLPLTKLSAGGKII